MGVRFECPAGHKLHVKAELAGKRGICPECGAKFVVPSFSGQRVAADDGVVATSTTVAAPAPPPSQGGARGGIHTASLPPGVPTAAPVVPGAPVPPSPPAKQSTAVSIAPPEPVAWYIRPAVGGQFGPASDEVFRQWIAEGRVAADSWVWRTGWADWKGGVEALKLHGGQAPATAAAAMAAADAPATPINGAESAIGVTIAAAGTPVKTTIDPTTAESRRAEIFRRKKKVRNLSILLALVALAMMVALVAVLSRQ